MSLQAWLCSSFLSIAALTLTSGCASAPLWRVDGLEGALLSSRLRYVSPERSSPIVFEMFLQNGHIASFLHLTRFHWSQNSSLDATFQFGSKTGKETLPVLEGGMRIRLSDALTQELISTLQEGEEVVILIDGMEKRLLPEAFSSHFEQFTNAGFSLKKFLKGPFG